MDEIINGNKTCIAFDCKNSWFRRNVHNQAQALGLNHKTHYHNHCHRVLQQDAKNVY